MLELGWQACDALTLPCDLSEVVELVLGLVISLGSHTRRIRHSVAPICRYATLCKYF